MSRELTSVQTVTLEVHCNEPDCDEFSSCTVTADEFFVGDPIGHIYILLGRLGWSIGTSENIAFCSSHRK